MLGWSPSIQFWKDEFDFLGYLQLCVPMLWCLICKYQWCSLNSVQVLLLNRLILTINQQSFHHIREYVSQQSGEGANSTIWLSSLCSMISGTLAGKTLILVVTLMSTNIQRLLHFCICGFMAHYWLNLSGKHELEHLVLGWTLDSWLSP